MTGTDIQGSRLWFGYLGLILVMVASVFIPITIPIIAIMMIIGGYLLRRTTIEMPNLRTLSTISITGGVFLILLMLFIVFFFMRVDFSTSTSVITTVTN
jgi:hypothetical protein